MAERTLAGDAERDAGGRAGEFLRQPAVGELAPPRKVFSAGEAVGCALSRLSGVPDGFLAGRLHRWTGQGKLRVRQPAEYYYETVLERTEP